MNIYAATYIFVFNDVSLIIKGKKKMTTNENYGFEPLSQALELRMYSFVRLCITVTQHSNLNILFIFNFKHCLLLLDNI